MMMILTMIMMAGIRILLGDIDRDNSTSDDDHFNDKVHIDDDDDDDQDVDTADDSVDDNADKDDEEDKEE